MTELDLHKQWINKDVPLSELKLTDGRALSIVHFGHYNSNLAGPDFSMGIVLIDGMEFVGPIEMHLKSSDWYQHNHHLDRNYDNVVLHVVYDHNADIFQNGQLIPTLELNSRVQPDIKRDVPICASMIMEKVTELTKMKNRTIEKRMLNRVIEIKNISPEYAREQLYLLLAIAFGASTNREQFLELCRRAPVSSFVGMSRDDIYSLLIEKSNIGIQRKSWRPQKDIIWNFKGLRPPSFPTVRIDQFASLCSTLIFDQSFLEFCEGGYFQMIVTSLKNLICKNRLSDKYIDHLMINCFIPFFVLRRGEMQKESYLLAMKALKEIKPEKNKVITMWTKIGVQVENAFDSQSLLELYNNHCCRKKCLSCDVGKELLTDR